jgi:VWFA-related protein
MIEALPLLESGRHRKKALLLISDGNDNSSRADLALVRETIRQSEALVYAIGLDAQPAAAPSDKDKGGDRRFTSSWQRGRPPRLPFPGPRGMPPNPPVPGVPPGGTPRMPKAPAPDEPAPIPAPGSDPVNLPALRDITDNSGGRTELLRSAADLGPATERIADELSKQYYLGYRSPDHRDGLWHTIRVEMQNPSLRVRARTGYVAAK